jgi:IS30 family transposase
MAGHGRRGPTPDVEKRERFARLIAQGVSNSRACQMVGIARKTGTRWRLGRTIRLPDGRTRHYPPVVSSRKAEISPRFLSEDERVRIADLRRAGFGVRAVAGQLGRSPSTVSRERAATATRAAGSTGRSPRSGLLPGGGPGPAAAS